VTNVVLATGNSGKVAEMQDALRHLGFKVIPQSDFAISEAVEDGLSFVENAIIKARHACELTGLAAIADDSGLEVEALNGAPGIYSSRYAAENIDAHSTSVANNSKLLAALDGLENRTARFQCVIVYMAHAGDPTPIICQGSWSGVVAKQACGDNGFGYDPIFYIPELKKHVAELAPEVKNAISHRAQALAALLPLLLPKVKKQHLEK
jgi:XTP/dITP diphosphohydrolase